jgi:hypothetical protein
MSASTTDKASPATVEARTSVTIDSAPDAEFLKRRMLLKGVASAAPLVLTLRAGPALASASNCAVVEMTPNFDPSSKTWSFTPSDRTPWTDPLSGKIACVETEINDQGQQCPTRIAGYFNYDAKHVKDFGCEQNPTPGGIVIAASSGGSFTH